MKSFLRAEKVLRLHGPINSPAHARAWLQLRLRSYHVSKFYFHLLILTKSFQDDGKRRLSAFWVPTGGIAPTEDAKGTEATPLPRLLLTN